MRLFYLRSSHCKKSQLTETSVLGIEVLSFDALDVVLLLFHIRKDGRCFSHFQICDINGLLVVCPLMIYKM